MIVVSGTASRTLGRELASEMNAKLIEAEHKFWPDGEQIVRIPGDVKGETVVLVQTTHPDEKIIELFLLQDALRDAGVGKLITLVPYFGYARQDKRFNPGEPISAKTMARHIEMQSDEVITIDIHNKNELSYFTKPVISVSAMPEIGNYLKNLDHRKPDLIIAPDAGSIERAMVVAKIVGVDFDHLEKKRLSGDTVEIKLKKMDVSGKKIAIVDDVISTGGTILKASKPLKDQGARDIIAACVHGVFTNMADVKMRVCCDLVIASDTIESERTRISAAPAVAKYLRANGY